MSRAFEKHPERTSAMQVYADEEDESFPEYASLPPPASPSTSSSPRRQGASSLPTSTALPTTAERATAGREEEDDDVRSLRISIHEVVARSEGITKDHALRIVDLFGALERLLLEARHAHALSDAKHTLDMERAYAEIDRLARRRAAEAGDGSSADARRRTA